MKTNDERLDGPSHRRRRRVGWKAAAIGAAILAVPTAVVAFDSLDVSVPLMPAVGESAAQACDTDGVSTKFGYGNTSSQGVKVTSVTVTEISPDCTTVTVDFMKGETTIASYSGAVSATSVSLNTNIFTNTFTSVRVLLGP